MDFVEACTLHRRYSDPSRSGMFWRGLMDPMPLMSVRLICLGIELSCR